VHVVQVARRAVGGRLGLLAAEPERGGAGVAGLRDHAAERPAELRPQVAAQHDVLHQGAACRPREGPHLRRVP